MTPLMRLIGSLACSACIPLAAMAGSFCDEDGDGVPDAQDVCCGTPLGIAVDETGRPIGDLDGDCDVDLIDYALMQTNFTGPLAPCPPECFDNSECEPDEMCLTGDGCGAAGECVLKPVACPDNFDPVCGCDGQTYSNACNASAAGVNVDYDGVCVITCQNDNECLPGEYCATDVGACGAGGECKTIPVACTQEYIPVCGCDGQTYSNKCYAAKAGVNIAHPGECPPSGCSLNSDCDPGEFCSKDEGDCAGNGECLPEPQVCAAIFDPVCGCDGQTYSNACNANAAGVSVASQGPCPETCRMDSECDPDQMCLKESCQSIEGECIDKPQACILLYSPVCGCDGQTYGNSCQALHAGVNIDHDGVCVPECQTDAECGAVGLGYCKRPVGDCNAPGYCEAPPQNCPAVFDPVCGCDGQTYSNACEASAAGVNVEHDGQCATECVSDNDCVALEYCEKPPSDCQGIGECAYRPQFCPAIYDPVCGCDGQTYGNSCYAAVAGVNVEYEGECCD
ncbi:MAG: Kazal-type serine protease inhibitor domain-containing protein [Phycisphaerae bacterium]